MSPQIVAAWPAIFVGAWFLVGCLVAPVVGRFLREQRELTEAAHDWQPDDAEDLFATTTINMRGAL